MARLYHPNSVLVHVPMNKSISIFVPIVLLTILFFSTTLSSRLAYRDNTPPLAQGPSYLSQQTILLKQYIHRLKIRGLTMSGSQEYSSSRDSGIK
jgi:hypothetical protein